MLMPGFVNIGAWVGPRTMVDTWATVGSCAQIGADVHLAGGVGIGGVLEPPQAQPVIVEDGAFIGSRCIVTEGVRIGAEAVLAANVVADAQRAGDRRDRHEAGRVPRRGSGAGGRRPRDAPEGVPGGDVPARLRADHRLPRGGARPAAVAERRAARVRDRDLMVPDAHESLSRAALFRLLGGGAVVLAGAYRVADAWPSTQARILPAPEHSVHRYVSRPDLRPPVVRAARLGPVASGLLFLGPFHAREQNGALIVDDSGEPVWFRRTGANAVTTLRVAVYRGEPVLTWWEGATRQGLGEGVFVVADQTYREIARFPAAAGRPSDLHELILTPRGTALVSSYETVPMDLRSIGGPMKGQAVSGVVQELELPTGGSSSNGTASTTSTSRKLTRPSRRGRIDYFHLNSIDLTPDGNLLVSARNTWAVYKIDHGSGAVRWRLGGKQSSFAMAPGTRFAWQHDARWHSPGEVSLFDNGAAPKVHSQSRALRIALDTRRMRASLVRAYTHSSGALGVALGSMQRQANGNWLVSWGTAPYFTELGPHGDVRLDGSFPEERWTCRTLRFPWVGRPADDPTAVVRATTGSSYLHVSWNGATEVASWALHAGKSAGGLARVATVPKRGFETALQLPPSARYAAAVALDRRGQKLGQSAAIRV